MQDQNSGHLGNVDEPERWMFSEISHRKVLHDITYSVVT